jgi:hypothetical protein
LSSTNVCSMLFILFLESSKIIAVLRLAPNMRKIGGNGRTSVHASI